MTPRILLPLLLVAGVHAQSPSVAPKRLAEEGAVEVDGRLDEPMWQTATPIGALTEVEPVEGRRPEKETVCRLAYDRDFLYVGVWCEEDPELVRARVMQRDARLDPDDRVEIWIDTFNSRRFAYWFQIGAGGSRGDALISDGGSRFNKRWDGLWYGRSRVTTRGWQAEIAFPFKTLGFRDGLSTWAFNLERKRKAAGRELRWSTPLLAYRFFDLSTGGQLTGLTGMRQGVGLDVVPYAKAATTRDRTVSRHTSRQGDFGLDVSYRITPSMNLLLTYNTDFAETEVDERRVNLTRFPLFFPEKRDFFLQDSDLFEFGASSGFRRSPLVTPFFSRRIGRDVDGNPVPVLGGIKLTGRQDGWNVGALGTLIDEHATDPEKGLGVLRLSRDVGEESAVGLIATGGRPEGPGDAMTGGVDFRLKDSRFFGEGGSATLWGYWIGTQNEGPGGDGDAYGLETRLNTRDTDTSLSVKGVESGFDPKLGFVRRTGIRRFSGSTEYRWRVNNDVVRTVEARIGPRLTTTTGNEKDSWDVPIRLELELESLDMIDVEARRRFERVPEPFEIRDGIDVSAGDYVETRYEASFRSSSSRLMSGRASVEVGDFYSGNLTRWSVGPMFIPNRYLRLEGDYQEFLVHLNEGNFTTRVTEGRVDLTFSADLSWRNLVQYDTDSKDMTVQSRLHWIIEPGQDLFLLGVWGWNKQSHAEPLVPTTQDVTLKVGYTLRF